MPLTVLVPLYCGGSCVDSSIVAEAAQTPVAPTAETLEHAEIARKQMRLCEAFDAACVGVRLPPQRIRREFKIVRAVAAPVTPIKFKFRKVSAQTNPGALASCTRVADCASVAEAATKRTCALVRPNHVWRRELREAVPHPHFRGACEGRCRSSTAQCGSHLRHDVGPLSSTVAEAAKTPHEALRQEISHLIVRAEPVIARRSNDAAQITQSARRYALHSQLDCLLEHVCLRCFAAAVLLINWKLKKRPSHEVSVRQLVRQFRIDLVRLHKVEIKILNAMYSSVCPSIAAH